MVCQGLGLGIGLGLGQGLGFRLGYDQPKNCAPKFLPILVTASIMMR